MVFVTVFHGRLSKSWRSEKVEKRRTGRLRCSGATSSRPFSSASSGARDGVGDGRGEARDQRLAEEVVARDEVDPHAPYINPKKIEEPRKLGADLPVLKPATPTPTLTPAPPAPVAPVPPPVEAGPRRMARAPRQQLGSK